MYSWSTTVNSELDKKLVEKYPDIFRDRRGNPRETLMCWGFECGDGWYNIIDTLCNNIQMHVNIKRCAPVVATQVKEKFGTLRFYYNGGDERIDSLVSLVEDWSSSVCEVCGERGELRNDNGWLYTACDDHVRKR